MIKAQFANMFTYRTVCICVYVCAQVHLSMCVNVCLYVPACTRRYASAHIRMYL